ncbi:hypothetical protein U6A24_06915 [Aquimarina gracilis]|uniref:TonB-like protein n=1 Tax=Aquimarina gracilis TaxID=874422 RepID=A0ABU5ZUF0_9FLAO|nr:hypothetical protein [Aquimarina gracilis]MEB3345182.1 hypothetical protein [Aquimarina gracilis]
MVSKRIWCLVGVLVFVSFSCDNIVLKKENKEQIIKERLDKLNWNEVEQPPLFEVCKEKPEEDLEQCFQNTISEHFQNHLSLQKLTLKEPVNDTIWIPLLITKNSMIIVEDFEVPHIIDSEIPNLKDIIEEGIGTLPKVAPAHTRGTPVTARYKLPLVIHLD